MTLALKHSLIVIIATAAAALTLSLMGRGLICPCGYVAIWAGPGTPLDEGSQHLLDLYTPSHLIHGLALYGLLSLVALRLSLEMRLAISLLIEVGWEILENTTAVIEHYRAVTISLDYNGDSVLNSTSDILAMVAGFYLAQKLPVWVSVAIAIGLEVLTATLIRDGLLLNVLMLLWPLEAVLQWQQGG
jgi:hypothetical protein